MRIGLINVDSNIANPALMKISTYHKARGNHVEWWLGQMFNSTYDKVYASKVFDFTPEPYGMPENTIKGGIAYDIKSTLPDNVDMLPPDYTIYPDCDYSVGFITRGCVRTCKFCKVPEKEGGIRFDRSWNEFENPNGKWWMLLDNNILGWDGAELALSKIAYLGMVVDFNQGLDIRLLTPAIADQLVRIKWYKFLRFAFDWYAIKDKVMSGLEMILDRGLHPNKIIVYVLIGFGSTPEQDMERVELMRGLGVNPYVMVYDRKDSYQKTFAQWVNVKSKFKSVKWTDFKGNSKMKKECIMDEQQAFNLLYK